MKNFNAIIRRDLLKTVALGLGLAAFLPALSHADDKVIRIGYQKYGTLVLLKAKGSLEQKLKAEGYTVTWAEFAAGPPLLEAINAGAIDFGSTGEAPPIFAQAAADQIAYVGFEPPAPQGEAILVPKDSPIKTVADLKGKKLAFNKGSNVHFLVVKALEKAGIAYSDVNISYLPPADARSAFAGKTIDAWAIWDPFFAAAEASTDARILSDGTDLVANYQFYLARKDFAKANPKLVDEVIDAIGDIDKEVSADTNAAAEKLGPATGIPAPVIKAALKRQAFGVQRINDEVLARQQAVADTFKALGLLPKAIVTKDAVAK